MGQWGLLHLVQTSPISRMRLCVRCGSSMCDGAGEASLGRRAWGTGEGFTISRFRASCQCFQTLCKSASHHSSLVCLQGQTRTHSQALRGRRSARSTHIIHTSIYYNDAPPFTHVPPPNAHAHTQSHSVTHHDTTHMVRARTHTHVLQLVTGGFKPNLNVERRSKRYNGLTSNP